MACSVLGAGAVCSVSPCEAACCSGQQVRAPIIFNGLVVAWLPQVSPCHTVVHVVAQQKLLVLQPAPLHYNRCLPIPGNKDPARAQETTAGEREGGDMGQSREQQQTAVLLHWVWKQKRAVDKMWTRSKGARVTGLPAPSHIPT